MKKDTRKVYKNERIAVNGTFVSFDGKGNPETKHIILYFNLFT